MRIGCFTCEEKKKVIVLCQRVPEDCPIEENNYPGTDPSKRIKEIQDAGYKTFIVWWRDVKDDMDSFKQKMDKFMNENYHPGLNS